jgi:predicted histidine transporter YuiF (NhaC family)
LGRALIDSGAAQWIINQLFIVTGIVGAQSRTVILFVLAFISLTSHIYMTSHTARAAALVPALLYLGSSLQLNPVAVLFISTVGMDYCLTFPVSSKALLMFQELEGETYKPADFTAFKFRVATCSPGTDGGLLLWLLALDWFATVAVSA